MKKDRKKIVLPPHTSLFGHPVQNNFFALIKKSLLTTPSWNNFWISFNFFVRVLGPPYEQKENFYIWGVGHQNRVKRVGGVHFLRNFFENTQNEDFCFKIWNTQYKIIFLLL